MFFYDVLLWGSDGFSLRFVLIDQIKVISQKRQIHCNIHFSFMVIPSPWIIQSFMVIPSPCNIQSFMDIPSPCNIQIVCRKFLFLFFLILEKNILPNHGPCISHIWQLFLFYFYRVISHWYFIWDDDGGHFLPIYITIQYDFPHWTSWQSNRMSSKLQTCFHHRPQHKWTCFANTGGFFCHQDCHTNNFSSHLKHCK